MKNKQSTIKVKKQSVKKRNIKKVPVVVISDSDSNYIEDNSDNDSEEYNESPMVSDDELDVIEEVTLNNSNDTTSKDYKKVIKNITNFEEIQNNKVC
ncbi:hypothetical protein ABK040_014893 [Willaertia magna]